MMFKDYLVEKYGYEKPIQDEKGFLLYRFEGSSCVIGELYVIPKYRGTWHWRSLGNEVKRIATERGCDFLLCQTQLTGHGDNLSVKAIIDFGFIPFAVKEGNGDYSRILYKYDLRSES